MTWVTPSFWQGMRIAVPLGLLLWMVIIGVGWWLTH